MKGVIFSTSFFIMIFTVFFSLSNYIHFDHNRSLINNTFKKTLYEVVYDLPNDYNMDSLFQLFVEDIEKKLPEDYEYTFQLLGYSDDPLLVRIKLFAKSKKSYYSFYIEEVILEEEYSENEI